MESFQKHAIEFRKQLERGAIQQAYRALMEYILGLRSHFARKYPEYGASGVLYPGYMDMTYLPLFPESLKDRKLKIAVVFVYETFRFEAWLSGVNKQVQSEYWELFKASGWKKHRVVSSTKGADSIVESVLADDPDFGDLDALTRTIEKGTVKFIQDIEMFLSKRRNPARARRGFTRPVKN